MEKGKKIKTHNGVFHIDEVTAVALLLAFHKDFTGVTNIKDLNDFIVRTRDKNVEADYFIDVDGRYEPEKGYFDHHQESYKGSLSSAGMVFKFMKEKYNIKTGKALEKLIEAIDRHDNGIEKYNSIIVKTVQELNDIDVFSSSQFENFLVAVAYMKCVIEKLNETDNTFPFYIEKIGSFFRHSDNMAKIAPHYAIQCNKEKEEIINKQREKAIKEAKTKMIKNIRFIIFEKDAIFVPMKYLTKRLKEKYHFFIQFDKQQNCWTVQAFPIEEGSFQIHYKLSPTNKEGEVFCHKAGFIGKYKEENNAVEVKIEDDAIKVPLL